MTNDIFDFNHISPDLTIDQELELKCSYQNCHQKCFLNKKAFQHYKKIKYGTRFVSMILTAGGIALVGLKRRPRVIVLSILEQPKPLLILILSLEIVLV